MHALDLFNESDRDFFEGKMKDIDIEYQDYLNLAPVNFFNRYKITKREWFEKYKDILPKSNTGSNNMSESMEDSMEHQSLHKLERVVKSVMNPEQLKSAKNYANYMFYHLRNKIKDEKDIAKSQPILNKIKEIEDELQRREQSFYDLNERYLNETQKHPAYQNLAALQKAVRDGTDAEIYFTGSNEPTMIEYPLARHLMGKYRALSQTDDRRRAEFLGSLTDARKFDQLTFQYKDITSRAQAMGQGRPGTVEEDGKLKGGAKDPCWKGYHMVGTKKKGGKEVPNCVPKSTVKENADDNPMTAAVVSRIINSRTDLLSKYGPEAVMQAVEEVTEGDTDWQEIGSSDVSAYVKNVEDRLADQTQGVAEGGYNPLDDERREQRAMDRERQQFKRDELDFELRGEEERFRQAQQQAESATWYLRINGRIWRKNGKPVEFRGVSAARRAGKTIKGRDPSKDIMLTTKPEDVTEASAQKPRFVDQHGNPLQKPAPSTPIDPEAIGNIRELPDGTRQKKTDKGWVTILGPKKHLPRFVEGQDDDIIKISKALDDLGGMLLNRNIDSGETLKTTAKVLNHQGLDAARREFAKIDPNERLQILKMLGSFGVDPKVFSNVMEQSRPTDFKLTKKYTMSPDGAKTDFYEVFDTVRESKTFFDDLASAKKFLDESIGENPTDTVEMDIPLLLRMLEFAREDAKTDLDLHHVTEKMIDLSRSGEALTMHNYENIVGDSDQEDEEDQEVYEGGKGRYWCKEEKRWKDR